MEEVERKMSDETRRLIQKYLKLEEKHLNLVRVLKYALTEAECKINSLQEKHLPSPDAFSWEIKDLEIRDFVSLQSLLVEQSIPVLQTFLNLIKSLKNTFNNTLDKTELKKTHRVLQNNIILCELFELLRKYQNRIWTAELETKILAKANRRILTKLQIVGIEVSLKPSLDEDNRIQSLSFDIVGYPIYDPMINTKLEHAEKNDYRVIATVDQKEDVIHYETDISVSHDALLECDYLLDEKKVMKDIDEKMESALMPRIYRSILAKHFRGNEVDKLSVEDIQRLCNLIETRSAGEPIDKLLFNKYLTDGEIQEVLNISDRDMNYRNNN